MATVNEKMTAIADEVRTLSGTNDTMGFDAMASHVKKANEDVSTQVDLISQIASALEGKAGGGSTVEHSENEDAIISRTIGPNYTNSTVTVIGSYAFNNCSQLVSVDFPNCENIMPYAFNSCSSLASANFPACTRAQASAFRGCINLATISLPQCRNTYNGTFSGCTSLTHVDFPMCIKIDFGTFRSCSNLSFVKLPACSTIGSNAFDGCTALSAITLGSSSVCKLSNSNAFASTPFSGYSAVFSGTPCIYVPSSLITAYQSATNWSNYSSYFSTIESLEG